MAATVRRPRGETTRAAVLAQARDLLIGAGVDGFVLREVAARSGITLGNLQYYFATRDDLLEAVFRDEFDRDLVALRSAVAGPSARSAAAELRRVSGRLVENRCSGGASVCAPLTVLAQHDERFARLNAEFYGTFFVEVGALVRRIDPGASDAEVATRARLITAVLDGVALQEQPEVCDAPSCDVLLARAVALVADLAVGTTRSRPARAGTS